MDGKRPPLLFTPVRHQKLLPGDPSHPLCTSAHARNLPRYEQGACGGKRAARWAGNAPRQSGASAGGACVRFSSARGFRVDVVLRKRHGLECTATRAGWLQSGDAPSTHIRLRPSCHALPAALSFRARRLLIRAHVWLASTSGKRTSLSLVAPPLRGAGGHVCRACAHPACDQRTPAEEGRAGTLSSRTLVRGAVVVG